MRVAHTHSLVRDPNRHFMRKEIVGDAHLIPIGVSAEREQRRVLGFPTEAPNPPLAGRQVGHHGRAAADAVTVAIAGILEGQQRLVRDRFNEPGAEYRDRHASHDDGRVRGNDRLAGVARDREEMEERFTGWIERHEFTARAAFPRSHFSNRARAADGWHAVAHGTARRVECRAEPFV